MMSSYFETIDNEKVAVGFYDHFITRSKPSTLISGQRFTSTGIEFGNAPVNESLFRAEKCMH